MFFDVQHCIWKSYSHTLILRFQAYTLKEWMRPAGHLRLLKRKTEVSEYFLELIPETQLLSSHRGAYGAMLGGPTVPRHRGAYGAMLPKNFQNMSSFCALRGDYPKQQNSVLRLKSNILSPQILGLATLVSTAFTASNKLVLHRALWLTPMSESLRRFGKVISTLYCCQFLVSNSGQNFKTQT